MQKKEDVLATIDMVIKELKKGKEKEKIKELTEYRNMVAKSEETLNGYRAAVTELIMSEAHLSGLSFTEYILFHNLCTMMSDDNMVSLPEETVKAEGTFEVIQGIYEYGIMEIHPVTKAMDGEIVFMIDPFIARRADIDDRQFMKILDEYEEISDKENRRASEFISRFCPLKEVNAEYMGRKFNIMSANIGQEKEK